MHDGTDGSPVSEMERLLLFRDVGLHVLRYLPITTIASLSQTSSRLRVSRGSRRFELRPMVPTGFDARPPRRV